MNHADALAQLARETKRARAALGRERVLRAALAPFVATAVWAAVALASGLDRLAPLAQSLAAAAALAALCWLLARAARRWRTPTDGEARTRLALDSNLDLAAFDALDDRPTRLDQAGLALWRTEQARAAERAGAARARAPRYQLNAIDPYRLRYIAIAALIGAAMLAGALAPERLARAFLPDPGPMLGDGPFAVEAWLTPADYIEAAPISLSDRLGERIAAPPRAEATVRVTGPVGAPHLVFEARGGARRSVRFRRAPDGAYEARLALAEAGTLRVVRFHTRARWTIAPAADRAPTIAFTAPVAFQPRERADIAWRAEDDFGVRALMLRATPIAPPPGLVGAAPAETPLETPAGDPHTAQGRIALDLADHPYAGMEVELRLVARDAIGQEGVSAPQRVTLPERVFLQPLARAALEIRRMVLWERRAYAPARAAPGGPATMAAGDILTGTERIAIRTDDQDPRLERAPRAIRRAAHFITALTMAPSDGYFGDYAVFLGFRAAHAALTGAREIEDTNFAADLLWRTALRAEFGGAADARRTLELAQQALNDALANGASPERIRQLSEALRAAMDNYLRALVQEAMRRGDRQTREDTEDQTEFTEADLQRLLSEIERLSREGRQAEAQALLQQLTSLLQNLDVQLAQGSRGEGGESGEEGEPNPLEESLDQLSGAMGAQRELNDQTEAQRQGGQGGGRDGEGLSDRQAAIRRQLEAARRQAEQGGGDSGESLQAAEQAMRTAENALRGNDLEAARAAQDRALAGLRDGAAALAREMAEQDRNDGEAEPGQGERDPLGRAQGGLGDTGDTRVPSQSERARAHDILDELRRRAQDARRPQAERDYLRRLLDRFAGS